MTILQLLDNQFNSKLTADSQINSYKCLSTFFKKIQISGILQQNSPQKTQEEATFH